MDPLSGRSRLSYYLATGYHGCPIQSSTMKSNKYPVNSYCKIAASLLAGFRNNGSDLCWPLLMTVSTYSMETFWPDHKSFGFLDKRKSTIPQKAKSQPKNTMVLADKKSRAKEYPSSGHQNRSIAIPNRPAAIMPDTKVD